MARKPAEHGSAMIRPTATRPFFVLRNWAPGSCSRATEGSSPQTCRGKIGISPNCLQKGSPVDQRLPYSGGGFLFAHRLFSSGSRCAKCLCYSNTPCGPTIADGAQERPLSGPFVFLAKGGPVLITETGAEQSGIHKPEVITLATCGHCGCRMFSISEIRRRRNCI